MSRPLPLPLPLALLALVLASCTTDPPTEPLLPVMTVTITGAPADGVVLNGSTWQLIGSALGPSGEPLSDRAIVWTSSEPGVATVNDQGRVDAKSLGETQLRARSEDLSAVLALSVREGTTVPSVGNSRSATLLNGLLQLTIPVGAAPGGTVIHARSALQWPANARVLSGTVVEIGPAGTELADQITVRVRFVPTTIPTNERDVLRLYGVDAAGAWVELPNGNIDLNNSLVSAEIMRLTTVAIFRPAAALATP